MLPPGFAEIALAQNLNPTAMAAAPDGRLFLAQKDGRVLILHADGSLHQQPFLSLTVDNFNERGLEGIALHPNFEQEPWVYLYYTVAGAGHNRVSRIRANGDFAVPGSEQILLELAPLGGSIHNGGAMVFGPDDNLYIGVGDGAVPATAQNLNSVLGKILRIEPGGGIPASNPFFNQTAGINRAIFAYGARNPFSMSVDPASGRIFFCDVGNGAWEEVNELKAGKNYGWSLVEGPLNGQSVPADYQDPLFAYPHSEGCAIVGATFGFPNHPSIPLALQGKFLFADYCKGWIKMLDPQTGQLSGTFATGIDRPVSLLTTPSGELYYFARAGLGGGSPGDNTASNEGTLWKIFWTGDGAPLITGQPQTTLVSVGETAYFSTQAFGQQPLAYQWLKNGNPIPGSNSPELVLENTILSDSGALLTCRVSNIWGADTSMPAVLRVTANMRPEPTIFFPSANATYRCGDTLHFVGQAFDPEESALPPASLSWRIDFFHADHTHPAMPPVQGISEGHFYIPTIGETATDVFFRVYLTAVDKAGLSKTTWRDVLPETGAFQVNGPPGMPMNVDGQIRPLPATVNTVLNIERHLQATVYYQSGDTSWYFRQWSNGQIDPVLTFQASAAPQTWTAEYDVFVLGKGQGLRGAYFFDPEAQFDGAPVLVRTDTIINFDWANGSPAPDLLPVDYFTVRWTGNVQPVFGETYTFSVSSDDGCRLWVGDSLLIDKWVPQADTEHAGSITLQGNQQYPIRLEYLEIGGGASVKLFWNSARQPKEIIPRRQLYLPDSSHTATIRGVAGIDQNLNGIWNPNETTLPGVRVSLFAAGNDSLLATQQTLANGRYDFAQLGSGAYYLLFEPSNTAGGLTPVENIGNNGQTAIFQLASGEIKTLNAAWVIAQSALYGTVWLDANGNQQREGNEPGIEDVIALLYQSDSVFVGATATNLHGGYLFPLVEPGNYFLLFSAPLTPVPLVPGHGLNALGQTQDFSLALGQSRELVVAFRPEGVLGAGEAGGNAQQLALSLWPNPVRDVLQIRVETAIQQEMVVELYNMAGQRVVEQAVSLEPGLQHWAISVQEQKAGMYVLVARTGRGVWQRRWVKAE
ncbi:MAG: PQQ-dependent sugar dehydrogenase [Saprospiraceae bacterium]|nr:PQQ-dependent sugar dehydrogenase [Saprospiraceae bacterium]